MFFLAIPVNLLLRSKYVMIFMIQVIPDSQEQVFFDFMLSLF
jgi:hypothetical protein